MERMERMPIELAEKIVDMLHNVTHDNVNFIGENGKIIASIQTNRIGSIHEGGKRIMAGEIDELAITSEVAAELTGVKPGYNGVVFYQNKRIGCIGLSGNPDKMRPLQQLATIIVREEYEKFISDQKKNKMIEKVAMEIEGMSAAIQEITASSVESLDYAKVIEEMANDSEKYIANINRVLNAVQSIADETKLLGFNAAIESARAGEAGRGFAVISKEISKLSRGSAKSLQDIDQILNQVRTSIINIANGTRNSTLVFQEQSCALQNISESVMEIQIETDNLTRAVV